MTARRIPKARSCSTRSPFGPPQVMST
jgi:hypothetical protein